MLVESFHLTCFCIVALNLKQFMHRKYLVAKKGCKILHWEIKFMFALKLKIGIIIWKLDAYGEDVLTCFVV